MKQLFISTFAAAVLLGCGESVPEISIHTAAKIGHFEVVKKHLIAGTDVNEKNDLGLTPLQAAVDASQPDLQLGEMNLRVKIIELLIVNGANVNAKYKDGSTPLEHSFSPTIIDHLIKHGGKTSEELKTDLLIQCSVCKGKVSRNAKSCPHCGEPDFAKN